MKCLVRTVRVNCKGSIKGYSNYDSIRCESCEFGKSYFQPTKYKKAARARGEVTELKK